MFDRASVSARVSVVLRCGFLALAALWWSGCGAVAVQSTGTTPAVERAWPAPLVSQWPWERLAPLVEDALREPNGLGVVAASLERWARDQGGHGSKRTLLGEVAGSPSYALVEVTESGGGSRPIRHYVLLFDLPPSAPLMRAAEAEVNARIQLQRYTDGDAYLHGFTANRAIGNAQPRFGGSSLTQLRRAWQLASLESEPMEPVSELPSDLGLTESEASIGEAMETGAQLWGNFWMERRVPMRGAQSLAHFDAVLHLFAAERGVSSSVSLESMSASLAVDDEPWLIAAGAWLGELIRTECPAATWVDGEELLSDYPALISLTGFKARPASYVRGRLTGDDLRSAREYLSAAVDGCKRL